MNDLIPVENEKNDAYSRILRFYDKQDIVLSAEDEEILKRWDYADKLMQQRQYKMSDVVDKLRDRFNISPFTAQSDIKNAQSLFGATRLLNKDYLIAQHLEAIRLKIKQAESDKSLAPLLPKLYDAERKAILALPDAAKNNDTPTPNIFIGVVPGGETQSSGALTFEQAKELLKQKNKQTVTEDIDYEDLK
jgi:hypothetical protein